MPRKYIRKTETRYTIEDLRCAVEEVKNKRLILGKAATQFSVPKATLFKQLKGTVVKIPKLLVKGCNIDMVAKVSDSGWINESIFIDYLRHFISFVKPTKENPVLLILDNHESHISLGAYELYREHGLHVLSLPPHVSHKMQPLDLTIFSLLKIAYIQ